MRQPAGTEPIDHLAWLVAIVADDEAAVERPVRVGNRGGRPLDRRSNPIGGTGDGCARVDVGGDLQLEGAHDVLPGHPVRPLGIEGSPLATHLDPLTAAPAHHALLSGSTTRPRLEPLALDLDDHTRARRVWLGIVDDVGPPDERTELVRCEVGPALLGAQRPGRRQQHGEQQPQQGDPPNRPHGDDDHERHTDRRPGVDEPDAERRDDRQRHDRRIGDDADLCRGMHGGCHGIVVA